MFWPEPCMYDQDQQIDYINHTHKLHPSHWLSIKKFSLKYVLLSTRQTLKSAILHCPLLTPIIISKYGTQATDTLTLPVSLTRIALASRVLFVVGLKSWSSLSFLLSFRSIETDHLLTCLPSVAWCSRFQWLTGFWPLASPTDSSSWLRFHFRLLPFTLLRRFRSY